MSVECAFGSTACLKRGEAVWASPLEQLLVTGHGSASRVLGSGQRIEPLPLASKVGGVEERAKRRRVVPTNHSLGSEVEHRLAQHVADRALEALPERVAAVSEQHRRCQR